MLINYFGNSSILSIYQKQIKKPEIERICRVVSSMKNLKRVSREILEGHGQTQKFIG